MRSRRRHEPWEYEDEERPGWEPPESVYALLERVAAERAAELRVRYSTEPLGCGCLEDGAVECLMHRQDGW